MKVSSDHKMVKNMRIPRRAAHSRRVATEGASLSLPWGKVDFMEQNEGGGRVAHASTMTPQWFSSRNFIVHQHAGPPTLLTSPTDGSTVPRIVGSFTLAEDNDPKDSLVFKCGGIVRSEVH